MVNNLKDKRKELNLTQEELAEKADISRYLISKIENGEDVNLTKATMIKLAEALDTSVIDIFFS